MNSNTQIVVSIPPEQWPWIKALHWIAIGCGAVTFLFAAFCCGLWVGLQGM